MDLLLNVRRARASTLVLVTHDAELASLADNRLVLRDGRPVTPDDALRNTGVDTPGDSAMSFVLRMAVREIRASWQRLLFFFVALRSAWRRLSRFAR